MKKVPMLMLALALVACGGQDEAVMEEETPVTEETSPAVEAPAEVLPEDAMPMDSVPADTLAAPEETPSEPTTEM